MPEAQAEAIADATRDFVLQDIATKADLAAAEQNLKGDIASVSADLAPLEQRLTAAMETLALRLTVRVGVIMAAGLSLMTALIGRLVRLH